MANSYLIERVLLSIAWPFILQQDKHVLALGLHPALSGELVSFCGFLLKDSPEVPQFRNSPFLTCILQRMIGLSKCQKMWVPIYLLYSTSFVTFGKLIKLSEPQYPHLWSNNNTSYLQREKHKDWTRDCIWKHCQFASTTRRYARSCPMNSKF